MTARAPAWFEKKYKAGAVHKLQSKGFILKPTTSAGAEIKGLDVTWKIAGTGEATQLSDAIENRPTLNADRTTVSATFVDYEANEWIKKADLNKMSEQEQQVAQMTCAMAMGRKFDKIILGTMDAAAGAITTIGDGSAAIDPTQIMQAVGNIADIGVGSYEYFCALPIAMMNQLMLYREVASSDYVGPDYPLLKELGARKWFNVTFVPCPSSYFAITGSGSSAYGDAYLWVKDCLGFEWNNTLESRIDFIPEKKAWFAASDMACAAAVLLPEGFQRLRFKTQAALTRPNP
jgi:hypothetical protein